MNKDIKITTLYKKDSKGKIRCWEIYADNGSYFTRDYQEGGKIKDWVENKSKPKNVGKANATTAIEQAVVEMQNEIKKKLGSDYYTDKAAAQASTTWGPMLCPSGMKWREYAGTAKVTYPAYASNKLDGARINAFPGTLRTREGKVWRNFKHIEKALEMFHMKHPNIILDGEGYNAEYHDKFQSLMSIFRKEKPSEADRKTSADIVQFYIYDLYDINKPDMLAEERLKLLKEYYQDYFQNIECIQLERSYLVNNEKEFDGFHNLAIQNNYEGSILRLNAPYEQGKRSKNLLKRKEVFDCEFKLIDVIEGEGTAAGIAAKVIIDLTQPSGMNIDDHVKLKAKQQAAGMAKGWDHAACKDLLDNKAKYIGATVTVEYFGITDDGKCRFPKFKSIRKKD